MANEKNILDYNARRTTAEARENGRKGGIASGKARRAKKRKHESWKEMGEMFLPMALKDGELTQIKSLSDLDKKNNPNITVEEQIFFALLNKAMKGDINAIRELFDMTGWNTKPTTEQSEDGGESNAFIKALEGKASEAWDDVE